MRITITRYLAILYALVLPVHYPTSIKIIFTLLLLSLFSLYKDKKYNWNEIVEQLKEYLLPFAFVAISLIGILYSENTREAIRIFTEKSLYVVFAFIIALTLKPIVSFRKLLWAFVFGTTIACIICLAYAIYRDITEGAYWAYYHLVFTDTIDSHPIYLGYFLNFTTAIVIYYIYMEPGQSIPAWIKWLCPLLICFYLFIHFLLAGRIPIVTIFFALGFWFFFHGRYRLRFIASMIAVAFIASVILGFLKDRSVVVDRFVDVFKMSDSIEDTKFGGHLERIALWNAGIGANTNFLFGVGTGDAQEQLNKYYAEHNYGKNYITEKYNSHSQYIQQYLTYGIIGAILFAGMMAIPAYQAIKQKNFLAYMFFAPFLIYAITEVFLSRYQGFAFYFFFYPFFLLREDLTLTRSHTNESK